MCGGRSGNSCGDGAKCGVGSDCQSGLCTGGVCVAPPPTCTDGMKDGKETDVDCGGPSCAPCAAGKMCGLASDCTSAVCTGGTCQAATATDGVKNDSETGVDCGGALTAGGSPNPASDGAPPCAPGQTCLYPSDCAQGVCSGAAPGDGGADGGGADAGGPLTCQPATPTDGVKNDSETDVDCGGALLSPGTPNPASDGAPICTHGQACLLGVDCDQGVCNDNGDMGGPPLNCPAGSTCTCQVAFPNDGVMNGGETDVDCGGATTLGSDGAPPCTAGLKCVLTTDCDSFVCTNGLCQAATCTDTVKNGTETDVDCGGATCPACPEGKGCVVGTDCTSTACNYASVCVAAKSCTGHNGGDTCGPGESDQGVTTNEDCCVGAAVTASHGKVILDKYRVTSGRMRAFTTAVNGNVRGFIQSQRAKGFMPGAVMDSSWDLYLPTAMDGCDVLGNCAANELSDYFVVAQTLVPAGPPFQGIFTSAYRWLGSSLFHGQNLGQQGCNVSAPGTHTYWMDDATQADYFGDVPADQGQALYDTRSLNCVPYLMAQSFCIWDGGRLEFVDEYTDALGVSLVQGNDPMPWSASGPYPFGGQGTSVGSQWKFPQATDGSLRANFPGNPNTPPVGRTIQYATWYYSYEYPDLGPNNDYMVFISAPGRMLGRGPYGHADLIGVGMEESSDVSATSGDPRSVDARWTANGSFEGHQWGYFGWSFSLVNRYGKQGLRCARPAN